MAGQSFWLYISMLLSLLAILSSYGSCSFDTGFSIEEATLKDLQLALYKNKLTSRQLVKFYLKQVRRFNPILKGIIEVNPDALDQASQADLECKRNSRSSSSPLHGIPVLLKDNIATRDKLNTTAGSFALLGSVVPLDAGVVTKLRKAGAIFGKASLSEWSDFRSYEPPNGWRARGGQGKNPYTLGEPYGSSSGSAISVAANMVAVSLGTETDGSILCPSTFNLVVGIKPTVGLTSGAGVVPISLRQDTVGTVSDAAYVLDAIVGADKYDNSTIEASKYIPKDGYGQFLREKLKGQELFLKAEATKGIGVAEKAALTRLATLSKNGFEQVMIKNKLDAIAAPGWAISPILAIGGFPGVSVPAGYNPQGVPYDIGFGGLKGFEPRLIEIAYGFEHLTKSRKSPSMKRR
ncbi:unnamed protein product [Citrullus colocynthis]|uniref:Amidase domain-containing protein n=1 Tax=Citrullus colocynthis TaxID=252529 RepID=A0ABP0Y6X4_9ROSI